MQCRGWGRVTPVVHNTVHGLCTQRTGVSNILHTGLSTGSLVNERCCSVRLSVAGEKVASEPLEVA